MPVRCSVDDSLLNFPVMLIGCTPCLLEAVVRCYPQLSQHALCRLTVPSIGQPVDLLSGIGQVKLVSMQQVDKQHLALLTGRT